METEFKNQIDLVEAFKKALEITKDHDMTIGITKLNVDLKLHPTSEQSQFILLTGFDGVSNITFGSISQAITQDEFQELLQMAVTKRQKKDTETLRNTLKI